MKDSEKLVHGWSAVHGGAGEAIRWISQVRGSAPRLDNEADDLIFSLRRVRNTARRLGAVAPLPMTVGFFGLSQAGKSYLISSLAAGAGGKLETELGGQRLDFLTHVNPPGGGKEATGLVTRFSRTARPGPEAFPLELKLFSEVELAKVLANAFFNDFNPEKVQYRYEESAIRQRLRELESRRQPDRVPGVSEDDVVSLWDYLQGSFPATLGPLASYYWPAAVALAPWLAQEDRARLFAIFWGDLAELESAYLDFARTLAHLGHASRVFAPLSVLVRSTAQGSLSQADSIMNVDMLERLGRSDDLPVTVCPWRDDRLQAEASLSLARLAALTAELVFPLREAAREPLFDQVDLLDFPGYRGRLSVESMDGVRGAVGNENASPVAQLVLRGKVAYLFERYTDSQEMNVLMVCTPSNKQSDVNDVGPVLDKWIQKTQGETPELRARRLPGLLWAVTMFDIRISSDLDKPEELLRIGWGSGGLMKMTMLERFGQYAWLQDWAGQGPFCNTFLVRKPRMKVPFLEVENGEETALNAQSVAPLALMRRTFIEDETVARHVHQPAEAWDAMLALNDGGMARIAAYLRQVALPEVKLARIREQLESVLHLLDNRLGRWFQAEGAGELEKKRQIAQQVSNAIWPRRSLLGDLLQHMQLPEDRLRLLYLQAGDEPGAGDRPAAVSLGKMPEGALNVEQDGEDRFDLFGSAPPSAAPAGPRPVRTTGSDARFAQAVLREWISHLRHIPEDIPLMTFLGFDKAAVEALVDELITAASRLDLQQRLLQAIVSTEQTGTRREQLVGRQVLTAALLLGDFTGWLDMAGVPVEQRPDSRIARGCRIFQGLAPVPAGQLPQLPAEPLDYARGYAGDWLVALARLATDNAGHSAGREITPEQNEQLGLILARLHGEPTE